MPRPGTSGESYLQDGASNTLPCAALKAPDCLGYLRAGIEGPMAITVKAFIRPDDAVSPIPYSGAAADAQMASQSPADRGAR